jgi:hypothetical protein
MKGFGTFALIVGACWLVFTLSMDVSVATGAGGRVNNLGLMADRQVHVIVGGMIALAGLLMVLLGGRASATQSAAETDTRNCPLCAEAIKNAAIKCKHCGGDVEKVSSPAEPELRFGWVARVICSDDATRASVSVAIAEAGFPVVEMLKVGGVAAGAFDRKSDAEAAADHLEKNLGFATTVMFRDKISGDYS